VVDPLAEMPQTAAAIRRDELIAALRARERFLDGIFGSLETFFTVDEEWRLTFVNTAAAAMAGVSPADLVGRDMWAAMPVTGHDEASSWMREAMAVRSNVEYEVVGGDGRTYRGTAYPLAEGGLAVYVRDVTGQQRAERALAESEERFRLVLGAAPVSVAAMDAELRYIWAFNQRSVPSASVIGLTDEDLFTPEEAEHLTAIKRRVLAEGVELREQLWFERPQGRIFLDCTYTPMRDQTGVVNGVGIATMDLTPMQLAEEARRASEERYRQLFQAESDALLLIDQQSGRVLEANSAALAMYGYSIDEFVALTDRELTAEPALTQAAGQVAVTGENSTAPLRMHRRKDGSLFPVEISGRAFDLQGRRVRIATVRDVSERKRAEDALRESEEVFRAMFDQSRVGKVQADPITGRFLRVNEAFCRFTGYNAEELLGRTFLEITHPDDRTADAAGLRELREGRSTSLESEKRYVRPDGRIVWGLVSVNLVRDAEGRARFTVGVVQDITASKEAGEALRESEERFRTLFEGHLAAMLLIESGSGQIIDANAAAARFYGYSREQLRTMRIEQINQLSPTEVAAERLRAADRSNNVFVFPHRLASGEVRFVEVYSSPVTLQGRPALFSIVHDVTARKQAEEALERTRTTLAEAQKIAHLGSFEYVAATATTVWSEEEYRIYGLDPAGPSPAYDVMLAGCIHPDDADLLHETFTRAIRSGSIYELEHRIVRPDGAVRWVYDRAEPYFDENREVLRYVGATLDITERRHAEEALLESEAKHATEQERARLARDLHDSVTQALFAASMKAEALCHTAEKRPERVRDGLEQVRRLTRGALAQMRTMLLEMRAEPLDHIPLPQLLRTLAEAGEGQTHADFHVEIVGDGTAPRELHAPLYRIAQEALNNVVRHAQARNVWVKLEVDPGHVTLTVQDDGGGFEPQTVDASHFGLRSMRERADAAGAELRIETSLGHGSLVCVEWRAPLPESASRAESADSPEARDDATSIAGR
jgi:PAS domain S-box-containing protein